MNLLFIGDIVGKPGRRIVLNDLPALRREYVIDIVIANAENAAAGFGVTEKTAKALLNGGVDVLTNGNHAWDKREALEYIEREPRLMRPWNYPEGTPGKGWYLATTATGIRVGVLNVMGQVFVHPSLDCPFRAVDEALARHADEADVILLDFHAEVTSEKMAMGWYMDGRVSAVVGTHTHVPTADERILPGGTAYITDVGMTGCYDSVIGMNHTKSLKRFVQKLPERAEVAEGAASLCAVLVDIDETTGHARRIERIRLNEPPHKAGS
ncbi:MAG: TIGR00282 family metallophosphoesterase [Gammaproteobacteria bacterium]|nr:TIGR00282 family metallophosphoesterase [Gammaproteobacteria bacterium]